MIPKNVRPGATAEGLTGEKVSFQIEANGKAFRTLIDGLYSNKVRAVTRELSSNAYDAQIEAGNTDVPFEVHLPTHLDPTFRVRDFGVSLSHEDVMTLYTTIFRSTKESTNEQTGQLGLGSKSPFAYTDTFSVIAYKDGERRVYIAYLETDGVPCITHVTTEPSNDPQGLEVSFPAKREDMGRFQTEMYNVLLGYPNGAVKVIGADRKLPEPRLEGDTWALYSSSDMPDGGYGHHFVRQGSVVYPHRHDFREISGHFTAIVDIPIGTAEVTASRESLSMDPETRDAIYLAFKDAETEIVAQTNITMAAEVAAGGGTRKAIALANKKYGAILNSLKFATKVSLQADHDKVTQTTPRVCGDVLEHASFFGRGQRVRHSSNRYITSVEVDWLKNFVLIVDDPSTKLVRRYKRIAEHGKSHGVAYVLSEADPAERRKGVAWVTKCLELTPDQIVQSDTLPDCPPAPRASAPRKPPRRLAAGQYWMPRRDGTVRSDIYGWGDRGTHNWPHQMIYAAELVKQPLIWDDVFFVNERDETKWSAEGLLPESRRLDKVIERKVKALLAKQPLAEAQTLLKVIDHVGRYNEALPVVLEEFFPEITINRTQAENVLHIAKIAKVDLQSSPIGAKVSTRVQELSDQYPLLFNKSSRKHFEQYVRAIKSASN
jgi:hypothetical protein